MNTNRFKEIETCQKYSMRCKEAHENIEAALYREEKITLSGIEKISRVRLSDLLTSEQMDGLISTILSALNENQNKTDAYLKSINIPEKPDFLDAVLQPAKKKTKNTNQNQTINQETTT